MWLNISEQESSELVAKHYAAELVPVWALTAPRNHTQGVGLNSILLVAISFFSYC